MSPFPEKHITVGGDDPFLPSLLQAINHANAISITTAFIRQTGLQLLHEALNDAIFRKAEVRILTGDYLGITDPLALRNLMLLQEQGAAVKVFQSSGIQSFHMKAYLFTRSDKGAFREGCAFVGSSNISQSALEHGLEWNLKVDMQEDPKRFMQILNEFDVIYNDHRSKVLTYQWIEDYQKRIPLRREVAVPEPGADEELPPPEPNAIQEEALLLLNQTRDAGFRRGLVVMATGLGKTWLAAFDTQQMNAKRVLFVAHREEILNQAEATFVRIRPDARVGRYDGSTRDINVDMLFASIQTFGRTHHLEGFAKDSFDYIVVDEFHHAAAMTYQRLLVYFSPQFLLGLTATPDRTDQSSILALCDDNLVFNKDLFDGIESKLLCPFHYFGIADVVDYTEIRWRNGKFDPEELVNQLATRARAKHNLKHWKEHHQTRTLAFCISQRHADFMAAFFNRNGVKSASVHSKSEVRRNEALHQLKQGELEVIFSVDLFNEGVDLPAIDTVLMLRPTESKIVFLQQLGRGLRNSTDTGKVKLVVLDFIGNHISFFRKPEALFKISVTSRERREFIKQVRENNLALPAGCFVNFDLQSINFLESLISTRVDLQLEIYRGLKESYGRRPTLAEFYRAGGAVDTVRREYGQWLNLVEIEKDLNQHEKACLAEFASFFEELEKTSLTKSFKLVLIEAFIELEGLSQPPTTLTLAEKSFEVLQRRRPLLSDLPDEFRSYNTLPGDRMSSWHSYWKRNPINAWTGGNRISDDALFEIKDNRFSFTHTVKEELAETFLGLVQEVVNYRFLQYENRLLNSSVETSTSVVPIRSSDMYEIPYFTDLKIACGHFRSSQHDSESIEYRNLPYSYGKLDPARHFIARASGESMNGGRNPIKDGDYLLLELITPESAGSINGSIIAAEKQSEGADDQYLLRKVHKLEDNKYELLANNPSYPPIIATDNLRTFARLRQVIDPMDLHLHQSFMREDIPLLFGLEFNRGLWNSGHVCPSGQLDQYLLVTLNKQGKIKDHQYHDYFIDKDQFHWQSQNSTSPASSKGRSIINHMSNDSKVHLFVRKNKLINKKAAPFTYCGTVTYSEHNSTKPMNVKWHLDSPLSADLFEYFV